MSHVRESHDDALTRGRHPEKVRVRDLVIDPDYQRDLVPSRVKAIMSHFEPQALGSLIVAYRDERYFLLDGQQRREALLKSGFGDMFVWCLVEEVESPDQESRIFDILNFDRTATRAVVRFRNAVNRGDVKQCKIKECVETAGWAMPLTNSHKEAAGALACVATLEDCYDNARRCDRLGAFTDMLVIVYTAYADEVVATRGTFIKGMYLFCRDYWRAYDCDHVIAALRPVHPDHILRQTTGVVSGQKGMAGFRRFVAARYNAGLRGKQRLPVLDIEEQE